MAALITRTFFFFDAECNRIKKRLPGVIRRRGKRIKNHEGQDQTKAITNYKDGEVIGLLTSSEEAETAVSKIEKLDVNI